MQYLNLQQKNNHAAGFSLVEVLVSISIFAVVVTMVVGTLIVLFDVNAKSQAMQSAINNVSFSLDSMVRDIRTGYGYECEVSSTDLNFSTNTSKDCTAGASSFAFTEAGGSLSGSSGSHRIGYRLNTVDSKGVIERQIESGGWQAITAPDVNITELDFVLTGASTGNNVSPIVTIYIAGEAGNIVGLDSSFSLQTTVTQQTLDI
jgi:prepilin-type N-terminal cleavage/methylation domain-containing protein